MFYKTAFIVLLITGFYMLKPRVAANKNIRNNNPLNIKESADWNGERTLNLDKTFEEFRTPEYGFRAGYIILLQYLERGQNTIESIVAKWAPANTDENNHTQNYINYVAGEMRLTANDVINPLILPEMMLHMSVFEGSQGFFTLEQSKRGAELAQQEDFVIARLNRLADVGYVVA